MLGSFLACVQALPRKTTCRRANGQPGGPDNPLGARALYLYQDGKDTLFRIHGTNAPKSIGKAMSSGCIRMLNQDVVELYRMTPIGTRVTVLPSDPQQIFEQDEIARVQ